MAFILSPVANFAQFFDNNGNPLAGGKLFTYTAGSFSNEETTWIDSSGNTENANPIVLDSSGRIVDPIWLDDETQYNFVLTLSNGTTVLQSLDDIGV